MRERIGKSEDSFPLPSSVKTVADLLAHLQGVDDSYANALSDTAMVKTAVNQVHVDHTHALSDTDEVAIFPPVTGG